MPNKMPGVDPQAEHQQETFEHELGEMRQLADDMLGQGAEAELAQEAVDQRGNGLAAGRRDFACLHGIAEDKEDTGQQREKLLFQKRLPRLLLCSRHGSRTGYLLTHSVEVEHFLLKLL